MFIFKIGGIFLTIWKFFKYFFWQVYTATKFEILNYDSKLQMTKTPKQRFIIWSIIAVISLAIVFGILSLIGRFLVEYAHI